MIQESFSDGPFLRLLARFGPLYLSNGVVPVHANPNGPFKNKGIDFETGLLLHNFVHYYKPDTIVELGTFRGYSTAWLIAASLSLPYICKVHAFEVFKEGSYGSMYYDDIELNKSHFTYHEIPGGIWNYSEEVPKEIDFIFHDTQHLVGPTIHEMELLLPRLSIGGIILIDDMLHPDYKPMQDCFDQLFSDRTEWDYSVLALGHGLGIARKLK